MNTNTFYVGTGEGWYNGGAVRGSGIWKSEDGGMSWFHLDATDGDEFLFVQKIIVHPSDGTVFAATRSTSSVGGGIFLSNDSGTSWTKVLESEGNSSRAADLEIGSDGAIYAALGIWYADGVYKSTDGTKWFYLF